MKKAGLTLLFLLSTFLLQAQTFGASGLDVKGNFASTNAVYNQWLRLGNTNNVTMKFTQTKTGLDEALDLVQRMLFKNGLDIARPDIYKNLEVENIDRNKTEQLNKLIQEGKARVNLAWFSPDGSTLHLFLDKNSYEVNVMNAYKIR